MTTKVVVVEDSKIAAEHVRRVLGASSEIEILGSFVGATELLASDLLRAADVVVLDLLLPDRSGLSVVREISERCAVVIVSDSDPDSPLAREAIAQGASTFVSKRDLASDVGCDRLRAEVQDAPAREGRASTRAVIMVGSTGAIDAMERTAAELKGIDAGLVVLLHLPPEREQGLARVFGSLGWRARVARQGDAIRVGHALIAPAGRHLQLTSAGRVQLARGEPLGGHMPSATCLLRSASTMATRVIAIVFSGMGRDGAEAIRGLVEAGATVLAQDPTQCIAPSMPSAALAESTRVRRVPLPGLASTIRRAVMDD